ncbi:MAG: hypothetical protein ACI9NI_000705 [Olleya marilimosa]|jgi:hypothetical protein|uniref:DUF4199 domain-containing protein n=1 Tax=Olleya marilimosa TaxID=272164 RepID=UPI0004890DCE|nr:DUF4199 domain-containing protein [Olleya marilimosa]PIB33507.1 hypothetical protein BFP78_04410 [Gaetbulibacter sp. 5U11]
MKNISLPIRFGLVISACLIAFFLILALFNLHTNPFFSLFNGVITGFGIYETIKYYKLEQADNFSYTGGFTVGIVAGFIAAILFTVFFTFYATEVDPDFLIKLLTVFKSDYNVHIGLVAFVVAIMGFATTVVITLTCMQLFKNSRNMPQN